MNSTGMYAASAAFGSLHALAMLAGLAGFVLLLAWAIKSLPPAQLKQWGLWLLVGGIIASLLTLGAVSASRGGMMDGGRMTRGMMAQGMKQGGGMGMMMGGEGMGMMSNMGMMLDGLEGDAFDEAFIRMMIPHHEGAIDMAEGALESAKHEEMKQLARDIIDAQQREIDMMKGWLTAWGYED